MDGSKVGELPSGLVTSEAPLAAVSAVSDAAFLALCATVSRPPSGEASLPKVQDERLLETGSDGKLSDRAPIKLLRCSWRLGGSGGLIQGESRYSSHVFTSKKSTSYRSPVCLSMKHFPSSGRRTKLVRMVKLTCAVSTRELRRTESPLRNGPSMFTHRCGTPAEITPAKSSGRTFTACL